MPDPLAMYGAFIGTAAAAGAIWNVYAGINRERIQVKVRAEVTSRPLPISYVGAEAERTYEYLVIKMVNVGQKVATIDSMGIVCRNGRRATLSSTPIELTPGQSKTTDISIERALQELGGDIPRRAFCLDAQGKVHQGNLNMTRDMSRVGR